MGEVEEEEPEDFVAPENALNALTYSQPKLWEHSSVQPQDFHGGDIETLPNPSKEFKSQCWVLTTPYVAKLKFQLQ